MAHVENHLSIEDLAARYRACEDLCAARHYQTILLLAQGHTVSAVSTMTSFVPRWIEELLARYNALGEAALEHRLGLKVHFFEASMYFLTSKIIGFFVVPSNFILTLTICGLLLWRTRFSKFGVRVTVASILFLLITWLVPIGTTLLLPLENRFQPWDPSRGAPTGIIVLGGVINSEVSIQRGQTSLDEAAGRLLAAIDLYRHYPTVRVIFSGGNANVLFAGPSESELAARFLERFGIPRDHIEIETSSRNTMENAVNTARLIMPKPGERWLLITSAYHMPRAIGLFRKAGIPIEAYPVDWKTGGWGDLAELSFSLLERLNDLDSATHEWVGLIFDRLSGRTSTLFPGP
jgi:uncharacterized SAM-binding protein YcdF (DUF218 family)